MIKTSAILLCTAFLSSNAAEFKPDIQTNLQEIAKPVGGNHWVAVRTDHDFEIAEQALHHATSQYKIHFGTPPGNGLVIDIDLVTSENREELDAFAWHLAWPFDGPGNSGTLKTLEAQLRQQIKDQLIESGQDASDAAVDKLFQDLAKKLGGNAPGKVPLSLASPGVVSHEIGHMLFMHGIWGSSAVIEPNQYGSTAPDWLDEAAAITAEDDALTHSRRQEFNTALQTQQPLSLTALFAAQHPHANSNLRQEAQKNAQESSNGVSIAVSSSAENPRALFYGQIRALLDYLQDKSGDKPYMRSITKHLKSGQTMSSWVHKYGQDFGLPKTIDELELSFTEYLKGSSLYPSYRGVQD